MTKDSRTHGIGQYHDLDPEGDATQQLRDVYAGWAARYDHDNDHTLQTVSQPNTVEMLTRHCDDRSMEILDYGCGTGLGGVHLQRAGFETFDGADISGEMLQLAEPRGYRSLTLIEPGKPSTLPSASYDAVLCIGVFTHGHLGPEGLDELERLTRPGGLICFTVNEGVWDTGFAEAIAAREADGRWTALENERRDYMVAEGVQAQYIAARLNG